MRKYSLILLLFAIAIAASLVVPSESLCKKCRKNKASNKAQPEEAFGEQQDEKAHVIQPGGQPKKDPSSEESEEEEAGEATPTPLASPKRSRRDHELRRNKELGEIATFSGHREVSLNGHDHDHIGHDGHRIRNAYYYHTVKRRQATDTLNAVANEDDTHAGHTHAPDASCSEEEGGGGAKLNAEAKVNAATMQTRRRRRALYARAQEREQRARAVDTNVFVGPDSSQTDDAAGAPILVRKPRGYDHEKWHCPRDAEEELLRMSAKREQTHKHEKRAVDGEDREGEEPSANAALKYPPGIDLRDVMERKMDEYARQPKGPFPGNRRVPVGPFPEPDLHAHYGHQPIGRYPKVDVGGLIANRHFNLEEGIRRREAAHNALHPTNRDGSPTLTRDREMDASDEGDHDDRAPRTHGTRELGEEADEDAHQPRSNNRRARDVDSDQSHVDEGVGLSENIRRKLESDLQKKKWLTENKQSRGHGDEHYEIPEAVQRRLVLQSDLPDTDNVARTGAAPEEPYPMGPARSRSPRATATDDDGRIHLGEGVRRKLEHDVNRAGRAGDATHQAPLRGHDHHQLGGDGHHHHGDHQHPATGGGGGELRLGEGVRRKLEHDLNRAGRAGDPNM